MAIIPWSTLTGQEPDLIVAFARQDSTASALLEWLVSVYLTSGNSSQGREPVGDALWRMIGMPLPAPAHDLATDAAISHALDSMAPDDSLLHHLHRGYRRVISVYREETKLVLRQSEPSNPEVTVAGVLEAERSREWGLSTVLRESLVTMLTDFGVEWRDTLASRETGVLAPATDGSWIRIECRPLIAPASWPGLRGVDSGATFVLTLQPGLSDSALNELAAAGITLVVPKSLHGFYSGQDRGTVLTVHELLARLRRPRT
ncbi:type II restriction endonuclease [Arthrobacter cupressi]